MNSRLIAVPLLLGISACASVNRPSSRMLTPANGPRARVYVSYFGGLTARTVHTTFSTDKNAYVIVGRLGGDGRVEILYPETPLSPTLVSGGKTYTARGFSSSYDGAPQLYQYASRAPRSYSARMDSYDGRGNGFVFIIATTYPMFTDILDDHGVWSDALEVEDYYSAYDPRYSITDLAETLTGGMPYTLDYASSFSSMAYTSYSDAQWDCAAFGAAGLAYGSMVNFLGVTGWSPLHYWTAGFGAFGWYFWRPMMAYTNNYSIYGPCVGGDRRYGYGLYAMGFPWDHTHSRFDFPGMYTTPVVLPSPAPTSPSGFTPAARRPGFRYGSESGPSASLTRQRLSGQQPRAGSSTSWPQPSRRTGMSIDRGGQFGSGVHQPRSGSSESFGSTRIAPSPARTSSPAAAPSTAAPAQRTPPPKVEASAGKPRDP